MLYDEPFSALDPLIRRDMQDEVMRLQKETGKTMVFITHDLPEALRLGDRIAIMRDGEIVQLGTGEELVGSPADDYVANFVRDIPRSHVLTLRWIMRDARPGEEGGPAVDVRTTIKDAIPVIAGSELPVSAVQDGRVVGVVDRVAALKAIAGEGSLAMSALTDIDVTATPLLIEHRPWWRSRVTLSASDRRRDDPLLSRAEVGVPLARPVSRGTCCRRTSTTSRRGSSTSATRRTRAS